MPRKRASDPSVTMSGGTPIRAMSHAFSEPPAAPRSSVAAAATGTGRCASRQSMPNTTAESPIMEPTERSMPPVTITGVSAIASSPSSTLNRAISNPFSTEKKWGVVAPKPAISSASTAKSQMGPPPSVTLRRGTGRTPYSQAWVLMPGLGPGGPPVQQPPRMMPPCRARSQYGLAPRNVRAGPIMPSSTTPNTVPAIVPRPPVIAVPPTTTAAMTCISSPIPALLGI